MAEYFNRTFKNKMYKYFTAKNILTYIDVLPQLVKSYNNTYHRTIKVKPTQVWDTVYGSDAQKRVPFKFQVGDRVRISKVKRMFAKSYLPNYTEEMFTIYKRLARQVLFRYLGRSVVAPIGQCYRINKQSMYLTNLFDFR